MRIEKTKNSFINKLYMVECIRQNSYSSEDNR